MSSLSPTSTVSSIDEVEQTTLIIASNRGPVTWVKDDGKISLKKGAGGLIVAVGSALATHPGIWISVAPDRTAREVAEANGNAPFAVDTAAGTFNVHLVTPRQNRYDRHYRTAANSMLWFTLHQLWGPYDSDEGWDQAFRSYQAVNEMVAEAIIEQANAATGPVEVHLQDYHLMCAASTIRTALPTVPILLYLHTPWVHHSYIQRIPRRILDSIFDGLSACDVVAVSSPMWAENLRGSLVELGGGTCDGNVVTRNGTTTVVNDFTLGIDSDQLRTVAETPESQREYDAIDALTGTRRLIIRADRSDLSKNILRGIASYERLLERHPECADQVLYYMLINPSRQVVPAYAEYLARCREAAAAVQRRFGEHVLVFDTENNFARVVAAMRRYDVLVANPVLDGTNLVAKEGPALNEHDGVLVLSTTAGAANVMHEALKINPFDVNGQADTLYDAVQMPIDERRQRSESLRRAAVLGAPSQWFDEQRRALAQAVK